MTAVEVQPDVVDAVSALDQRLAQVIPMILPGLDPSLPTSERLDIVCRHVRATDDDRFAWLLFIGLSGNFPSSMEVTALRRAMAIGPASAALVGALSATIGATSRPGALMRRIEVVSGRHIIDVDFCAKHEHNTGIQRVVRQTIPVWVSEGKDVLLVAWDATFTALRGITDVEVDRVLNWNDRAFDPGSEGPETSGATVIVPWDSEILLAEVPSILACPLYAAIARYSGNRVSAIGYDAIPLVSAESQSDEESERFAVYLSVIKHARSVVAISESAAEEFRGFCDAVVAQGLTGPNVTSVSLAVEVPSAALSTVERAAHAGTSAERPLVLCVGSHEPRKNQDATLYAAEQLFRQGVDFELVFVGGGTTIALAKFDRRIARLRRRGAHISSFRHLADSELWEMFARAKFTVFLSLHEGFGLPVAESLVLGTPVLTSNFGSLAEIARNGGCVMVDPRDDRAILAAFRSMLTDDSLLERLTAEAAGVTERSWRTYAGELWATLYPDSSMA